MRKLERAEVQNLYPGNDIDNYAVIYEGARIGKNNVIGPFAIVGPTVRMLDGNTIESGAKLAISRQDGPGILIGSEVRIEKDVHVSAGDLEPTRIGDLVDIMHRSNIHGGVTLELGVTIGTNCTIDRRSWLCQKSSIIMGTYIGERCFIGAHTIISGQSVLPKRSILRPFEVWGGIPTEYIRMNTDILGTFTTELMDEVYAKHADKLETFLARAAL